MILIDGPAELCGEITIQGAKNSTLPLLAATVLCRGQTVLHNCPCLSDVDTAVGILEHLGCRCRREDQDLTVDNAMTCCEIPDGLMRGMRSSIVFLGAIVSRCGEARLCFPGGLRAGPPAHRPAPVRPAAAGGGDRRGGRLPLLQRPPRLQGSYVSLAFPSVGATGERDAGRGVRQGHHGHRQRRPGAGDHRPGPPTQPVRGPDLRGGGELRHHRRGGRPLRLRAPGHARLASSPPPTWRPRRSPGATSPSRAWTTPPCCPCWPPSRTPAAPCASWGEP